jgi:hypothetical protein
MLPSFAGSAISLSRVAIIILVVIIVWVSRRHRIAYDGELDQQSANALRDAWAHDNSCRNVAMSSCPSHQRLAAALRSVRSNLPRGSSRNIPETGAVAPLASLSGGIEAFGS